MQILEDMVVWRKARVLAHRITLISKRSSVARDFGWIDQISRSSLSIMANIAEGNDATSNAEFVTYLGYAKRSAAETRSHIHAGFDRNYLNDLEYRECIQLCESIAKQLATLVRYIRGKSNEKRQLFCNLQHATRLSEDR